MRSKRGQAAFEYLFTYGWAILAAIIAIGALSYFGFISPSNLLPNKCSFGKQMECVEAQILYIQADSTDVNLMVRNNFGKPVRILEVQLADADPSVITNSNTPVSIGSGNVSEVTFTIDTSAFPQAAKTQGEKLGLNIMLTFERSDVVPAPDHNITGYLFTTVS